MDRAPRLALAPVVIAFSLAVAGCGTPSDGPTPGTGSGWSVVAAGHAPSERGLTIAPEPGDSYLVTVTVAGAGGDGCGAPTFAGFDATDGVLVARIDRAPTGDVCLVTSDLTIAVRLERSAVPSGVDQIAVGEDCDLPGCAAYPVPIP